MKLTKLVGLAAVVGSGYAAYRTYGKIKELKEEYNTVLSFTGDGKKYETFEGDSIAVTFAGVLINLTEAEMIGDTQTLKIYGEFCNIEVKVPSEWNVKAIGSNEKSSIANTVIFDGEDTTSKLLIIDYDMKYAGLDISTGDCEECVDIDDILDTDDILEADESTEVESTLEEAEEAVEEVESVEEIDSEV